MAEAGGEAVVGAPVVGGFLTCVEVEAGEDLGDVVLGAIGRDAEFGGDLGVGQAAGEEGQDLALAGRQFLGRAPLVAGAHAASVGGPGGRRPTR